MLEYGYFHNYIASYMYIFIMNRMLKRVDVLQWDKNTQKQPTHSSHEVSTTDVVYSKHLPIFYTSLARSLVFPRHLDEINADGETVHYSPYDPEGRVFPGVLVTDNGFWDTFRTVYPMLALIYPRELGDLIQGTGVCVCMYSMFICVRIIWHNVNIYTGWLNAYVEGGWLPSWASPGYRNCMVGTYADVVIADAIIKGIPGFDYGIAYDALHKDAFQAPPDYAGILWV